MSILKKFEAENEGLSPEERERNYDNLTAEEKEELAREAEIHLRNKFAHMTDEELAEGAKQELQDMPEHLKKRFLNAEREIKTQEYKTLAIIIGLLAFAIYALFI